MLTRALFAISVLFFTTSLAIWPAFTHIESGSQILWLGPALQASLHCKTEDSQHHDQSYVEYENYPKRLLDNFFYQAQKLADRYQFTFPSNGSSSEDHFSEDTILKKTVRDASKSIHGSKLVP